MGLPYQAHSMTSAKAAAFVTPYAAKTREKIFLEIWNAGTRGCTDEELAQILRMNPNTVRPRRVELMQNSLIQQRPHTRKTSSGAQANVWITTGFQYDAGFWKKGKDPTKAERKKQLEMEILHNAQQLFRGCVRVQTFIAQNNILQRELAQL